jgi:hypothetical protein
MRRLTYHLPCSILHNILVNVGVSEEYLGACAIPSGIKSEVCMYVLCFYIENITMEKKRFDVDSRVCFMVSTNIIFSSNHGCLRNLIYFFCYQKNQNKSLISAYV